jgi:hypothetical protein
LGRVGGDVYVACPEPARSHDHTVALPGTGTAHLDVGAGGGQHFFGVGSCRHGFVHGRGALSTEAGQEDRRFHLGTRHRQRVLGAPQAPAPYRQRRQAALVAAIDARPHEPQGDRHPVHGPAGDRGVALQDGEAVDGGHEPGQQPDAGARVSHVDDRIRLVQAGLPTVDVDLAPRRSGLARCPHGPCPQGHHRRQSVAHVVPVGEAPDP